MKVKFVFQKLVAQRAFFIGAYSGVLTPEAVFFVRTGESLIFPVIFRRSIVFVHFSFNKGRP